MSVCEMSVCDMNVCERSVWEEEAPEEAEEEKAAGAELKTKTPHKDVGNNLFRCNRLLGFDVVLVLDQNRCDSSVALHMSPFNLHLIPKAMRKT